VFDPARHEREQARYALAAAMPGALERGEFTVEYQPIVRLAGGTLYGVEALVRWRHPDLGTLLPRGFIGLAEETGLIVPLGRWVLRETCREAGRWYHEFPEAELLASVNLAAAQVRDEVIVAEVSRALAESGLPARLLQLELTESAAMDPAGTPLPALRRLADLGVRIAIDDFGTGYSNLAYLRTLPIQSLKLAGQFIAGLSPAAADPVDERIVDALVRLAHALGLTVTAEAVETSGQAAVLRRLDCDTAQGRWYAGALSASDVTTLLKQAPVS
jgi:EAL domain-containing protein (putative c-di-GMP-specific phosphodiesterase class I)